MILAAVTMTLRNTAANPLWIHTLKAQLTTADDKTSRMKPRLPLTSIAITRHSRL